MGEKLLRAKDVMDVFGVHRNTITSWKRRGILRAVDVGGIAYFRRGDVEQLINGRTQTPQPNNTKQTQPTVELHEHQIVNSSCTVAGCELND